MTPLPFEKATVLCDRICAFLLECGPPYGTITAEVESNILGAIASKQFVIKIKEGEIRYFAGYFKVKPEHVDLISQRTIPAGYDLFQGSIMYVTEAANKDGRKGMAEIIRRLRKKATGMQGVFWHRPKHDDKIMWYPRQRGGELHGN